MIARRKDSFPEEFRENGVTIIAGVRARVD
jgi:hypothetical protein